MTKLYLDDYRTPIEKGWVIVRSFEEFKDYLDNNPMPSVISFDHDLAEEHYHNAMYKGVNEYRKLYPTFKHKTGYHCARYLREKLQFGKKFPECNVHSQNPAGSEIIQEYLMSCMLINGDCDPTVTKNEIPHV